MCQNISHPASMTSLYVTDPLSNKEYPILTVIIQKYAIKWVTANLLKQYAYI